MSQNSSEELVTEQLVVLPSFSFMLVTMSQSTVLCTSAVSLFLLPGKSFLLATIGSITF